MSREYIPLFLDFNDSTQDLTDEECGRLVRSIVDYANGKEYESRLTGAEKIAFRFLKGAIDRNQAISEVRAKAGASKKKSEQTETNENKTQQTATNSLNNNNNKNKNNNKNNNVIAAKAASARFIKPTVEEVRAYIAERNKGMTSEDAEVFVDFYESKGWKVGSQPMKDWKAAVRTWEQRNNNKSSTQTKKVVAQQYGQRDYSKTEPSMEDVLKTLQQNGLLGA